MNLKLNKKLKIYPNPVLLIQHHIRVILEKERNALQIAVSKKFNTFIIFILKPFYLGRKSPSKSRKSSSKIRKKLVQPIPLDATGRPVFPIELGSLTIHSLGEVLSDRKDFHCEEAIYPVGYVSTRYYGSLKDPTIKCIYTCKISDAGGMPR